MWIIDFARYRVEWLYSLLVRLGGSLEENLLPRLQEAQQFLAIRFSTGTIILTVQVMHLQ